MRISLSKRYSTLLLCLFFVCSCGDDTISPPDTPAPEPPTNLVATQVNQDAALLEWTPSATPPENIRNYILLIPVSKDTFKISKTTSSYEVRGLDNGKIYTFLLKAQGINSKLSTADTAEVLLQ